MVVAVIVADAEDAVVEAFFVTKVVAVDVALIEVEALVEVEVLIEVAALVEVAEAAAAVLITSLAVTSAAATDPHNAAGVYTGIDCVVPYPATPHAGLVGLVKPDIVVVIVTVLLNAVGVAPLASSLAQYPVP